MSGAPTATKCGKCSANLPEESQFCPKCGQAVSPPVGSATPPRASKASLVQDQPAAAELLLPPRRRPRRRRFYIPLLLMVTLAGMVLWAAGSDNPIAQNVQEFFGWKHDQAILETPFTVAPHSIQYFKFSLPEGSVNVSIVGDFTAAVDNHEAAPRKTKDKNPAKDASNDDNIEVFVLTESAFAVWQNGYSTGSLYESGRVPSGNLQADLPAGSGIYYLVFSNKFAPATSKRVQSAVFLRYHNWLPDSFRRLRARISNWFDW